MRTARLIEKPLHQQRVLRGQGAEGLARTGEVFDQLFGAGQVQAEVVGQPIEAWLQIARRGAQQLIESGLQARHGKRQFSTAPRASPSQNGMVGGWP